MLEVMAASGSWCLFLFNFCGVLFRGLGGPFFVALRGDFFGFVFGDLTSCSLAVFFILFL